MGLPDESKFTFETLCERWIKKYGDCTTAKILDYVNSCRLKMKTEYPALYEYDPNTGKNEFIGQYVKQFFTLAEVLRFEAEHPPTAAAPEVATTQASPPPPKELLKVLVARVAWEVHKETGKMNYKDVLDKLRIMAKSEDQAGAIIATVSTTKGVSIIGRDEPIAVGTIENWLRPLRAEAKRQAVTESRK